MASCQYCGTHEPTDFNLAGYTCTGCRPQCLAEDCNASNFTTFPKAVLHPDSDHEEAVYWCMTCGTIAPQDHVDQEDFPVDGPPDGVDVDLFASITIHDPEVSVLSGNRLSHEVGIKQASGYEAVDSFGTRQAAMDLVASDDRFQMAKAEDRRGTYVGHLADDPETHVIVRTVKGGPADA